MLCMFSKLIFDMVDYVSLMVDHVSLENLQKVPFNIVDFANLLVSTARLRVLKALFASFLVKFQLFFQLFKV